MARSTWTWTLALCGLGALAAGCSKLGARPGVDQEGCEAGFHACGSDCMPDASPMSCVSSCTPCPVPENGAATCTPTGCGVDCRDGYHDCGDGACHDDASATECGPTCEVCPQPAGDHAHRACISGACGFSCDLGWLACETGCCAAPVTTPARLGLGARHSCAVGSGDVLRCWGSNELGQLGSGSMSPDFNATPAPVTGLAAGAVAQVGVAFTHTCAVDQTGGVRCWGCDGSGQLGDGTFVDTAAPVTVTQLAGAIAVDGGRDHTCALLGNGTARCWGTGEAGQLGDGHPLREPRKVEVRGLAGAFGLVSGLQFNCAFTGVASMVCWGDNVYGQLGTAAPSSVEAEPAPVAAVSTVTALRALAVGAQHTCAAYDAPGVSGGVRCWGRGDSGQLGNGTAPTTQRSPVEVTGLTGVTALAAGDGHTCALTSGGGVVCWGLNNSGQLGDGTRNPHLTPAPVSGLASGVRGIAAGGSHTCAELDVATPALKCWGANASGQLGDGTRDDRLTPTDVIQF